MPDLQQSQALWQAASQVVPRGIHSDSRWAEPHPLIMDRAQGAYLWDVDGNRWMDCTMGNGAVILGHNHPAVNDAVSAALRRGLGAGYETELSVQASRLMCELLPGVERVRFANTGTEAAMHAIMMARARTGRERVAKPEGGYDGWYDFLWVSTWGAPDQIGPAQAPATPPGTAGLSRHARETVVLPFNDLEATSRILHAHKDELAAVVMEPTLIDIGFAPARQEYLAGVREVTRELGIVLIFDELLTGFRLPGNSAAAYYGITPDLSMYGKAIGNGHIVAAVTGLAQFMEGDDLPQFVGTFNSHALSMAAVNATLKFLSDGNAQAHLEALTGRLGDGLRALGQRYGFPVQFQGHGGKFQVYFNPQPVVDYRSAFASSGERYAILAQQLRADGIRIAGKYLLHSALSHAHAEEDVQRILASAELAFRQMAQREA